MKKATAKYVRHVGILDLVALANITLELERPEDNGWVAGPARFMDGARSPELACPERLKRFPPTCSTA